MYGEWKRSVRNHSISHGKPFLDHQRAEEELCYLLVISSEQTKGTCRQENRKTQGPILLYSWQWPRTVVDVTKTSLINFRIN